MVDFQALASSNGPLSASEIQLSSDLFNAFDNYVTREGATRNAFLEGLKGMALTIGVLIEIGGTNREAKIQLVTCMTKEMLQPLEKSK